MAPTFWGGRKDNLKTDFERLPSIKLILDISHKRRKGKFLDELLFISKKGDSLLVSPDLVLTLILMIVFQNFA